METFKLTKFTDSAPDIEFVYEGNEGAGLMALMDADEHVRAGGWCMLEHGNVAQMITRPVFNR